jgi:homocysteine S-methyltransferase
MMSAEEAEAYHSHQVNAFSETAADMVCALTMTHSGEAIGIARAAQKAGLPVVISFTVETDGRLPSGQPLAQAIAETDEATEGGVAYYMINCAHPEHFESVLKDGGEALARVRGLRANASRCSHAELDEAEELDDGNPVELGTDYVRLRELLPNLNHLGGCCGTDVRHVREIAGAWTA